MRSLVLTWGLVLCLLVTMISAGYAQQAGSPPVNGKMETIGTGTDEITVLYLWGTPYEMGYAHGKLAADKIKSFYAAVDSVLQEEFKANAGMLGAIWMQLEPFVPPDYLEEMKGLADGSGLTMDQVKAMHALPDASEYHCSYFAAWGKAVPDGHLYQMRCLDYAMKAHIQEYPALLVQKPNKGNIFVNVGWLGMIGVISGMNANGLGVSEIGDNFGPAHETLQGEPMPFLLREVLQRAGGLDEAVKMIQEAKRTSSYHYCVGDAKKMDARGFVTCMDYCQVHTGKEQPHYGNVLDDVVYLSMGRDDTMAEWMRSDNKRLYDRLKANYGKITPERAAKDFMPYVGTGGLQAVVYDLTALKLWAANANGLQPAYKQTFVQFDVKAALDKFPK